MKTDYLPIWSKLLDGVELNHNEILWLDKFVQDFPDVVPELVDELGLHKTLELNFESDANTDEFVQRCLEQFNSRDSADSVNLETAGFEIDTRRINSEPIDIERIKNRKSVVNWSYGVLTAAAVLMISLFLVVLSQVDFDGFSKAAPDVIDNPESTDVDENTKELPDLELVEDGSSPAKQEMNPREPETQLPDLVLDESNVEIVLPQAVAELFVTDAARFDSRVTSKPVPGTYKLTDGEAIFKFENQVIVFATSPAEFELVSKNEFKPLSGRFLIDSASPEKVSFAIVSRDTTLSKLQSTRFWIDISENGTSVNLNRGNVAMLRDVGSDKSETVDLGNDGLQNAYVNNVSGTKDEPASVLIAHGQNDRYFAQIGWGENQLRSTTPNEVERLIQKQTQENGNLAINSQLQTQIMQFNQRLQELKTRFQDETDDALQNGAFPGSNFVPSPFHINQTNPFSKFKEFENFAQKFMKQQNSNRKK